MAYNYFPQGYTPVYPQQLQTVQPVQAPTQPVQAQNTSNNGLIWVQGESGAKSYLVAPNTTVLLMDSEGDKFYLKSADNSGMPLPLRIFEYREVGTEQTQTTTVQAMPDFVTKSEFDNFCKDINSKFETLAKPKLKVRKEDNNE